VRPFSGVLDRPAEGMLDPRHCGRLQLARRFPAVRYEKRIGETKNAFFWNQPPTSRQTGQAPGPEAGSRPLSDERVASVPEHLRWIDAVFAPERLGKPGRTAEAVLGSDAGQRFRLARAQHLGSRLFQPRLL